MEVSYAAIALRRWWPWVAAGVLVGLLGGVAYSVIAQEYRNTSAVLIGPPTEATSDYLASPERYVRSQAQLVKSDQVITQVLENSDARVDAADVRSTIEIRGGDLDNIVEIDVTTDQEERSDVWSDLLLVALVDAADSAEVLRSGSPTETLSTSRSALVGGVVGGAVVTGLMLVMVAFQRPLLSPRSLQLLPSASVYPEVLSQKSGERRGERVSQWLSRIGAGSGLTYVGEDAQVEQVKALLETTSVPAAGTNVSTQDVGVVLHVFERYRCREREVERQIAAQAIGSRAQQAVLVIESPRGPKQ